MHELAIGAAVVDSVLRHADGRRVVSVQLRVGRLRQIVPDALEFAFELCARESVCEGARLEQELLPAVLRCAPCGVEWEVRLPAFRCPACGGADIVAISGEELEIESIEVEEEASCIA